MDDDDGYRFEGESGVGGAVGSAESGLAENDIDIGDAITSPLAAAWGFCWTTISDSESEERRDDNSDDSDETEGERMRVF